MQIIKTNKGQQILVDSDTYDHLGHLTWYISKGGYPVHERWRYNKRTKLYLHRLIMNTPEGMVTDHINGDKLDNRKENLRICTQADNTQNKGMRSDNSTGYKGVTYHRGAHRYTSEIKKNGKRYYLGLFDSAEEAYEAYKKASKEFHGEFSRV